MPRLEIDSDQLVIKELIGKDSNQSKILNDTLTQIHLDAAINTTTTSLLNINKFPAATVRIHELSAQLQTTPNVFQGNGNLIFDDDPGRFNIGFDSIDLKTSAGEVNIRGNLLISDTLNQKIEFSTILKNVDVIKSKNELKLVEINYDFLDSLDGNLNSDFDLLLLFSPDSFEIQHFSIKNMNYDYTNAETSEKTIITGIDFSLNNLKYDNLKGGLYSYRGSAGFGEINTAFLKTRDISFRFNKDRNIYHIFPDIENILGGVDVMEEGTFWIDVSDSIPSYYAQFKIQNIQIDDVMEGLARKKILEGKMNFDFWLTSRGNSSKEFLININGEATSTGKNLILSGVDLDHILNKIQRFQSFNLVDVSAYFIAGPLAPLATKGYDVANMITMSLGGKTQVTRLISDWKVENGVVTIKDAALTTTKNRIAVKGQIDIIKGEMINVTVAVLNRRGCSLISQTVNGLFAEPELGKLQAVGPIKGTLKSLIRTITGTECEPFYTGSLAHPD